MPLFKIDPPPGISKSGTDYQTGGRWIDSNGFRWLNGDMVPWGGWQKVQDGSGDIDLARSISGMHAWRDNDDDAWLLAGINDELHQFSEGTITDVTPAGFTTGNEDATIGTLYGAGNYGAGTYGSGDPAAATIIEAQSWQFDTFGGAVPFAWAFSDKKIYEGDVTTPSAMTAVTNAPTNNLGGMFVTGERHVVALGADGEARTVKWSDKEARTTWTAASTNEAGDFILKTDGAIMCGARAQSESLIWTTTDLHAMKFIGGTLIFRFDVKGINCGIIGRRARARARGLHFWMGHRGFWMYDGFVRKIPCEIEDFVFSDMNRDQSSKFHAVPRAEFNEVWFYYCSSTSTDIDRAAIYNYEEGHWYTGYEPNRTAGVDRGVFHYPMLGDSTGAIYDHERGSSYLDTDDATTVTRYAETGPFEIGQGDRAYMVRQLIPDANTVGALTGTLYARDYPTDTERNSGTITLANPTSVRLSGRQMRLRVDEASTDARVGTFRADIKPTGKRT